MVSKNVLLTLLACLGTKQAGAVAQWRLRGGSVSTLQMHMFRSDCGKSHALASKYGLKAKAKAKMPGAGMDPASLEPFEKVLKDGFYEVACVKDMMFTYGDKFHDNKFEYNLGEIANVSIVHYDSLVAKEDREPMSHEVCFDFCRSIPEMTFFGLQNGRMCYCAPYYKAMESDSTMCDVPCPGSPTTMCGGNVKSSVFAMHQCQSTAMDLAEAKGKLTEAKGDLDTLEALVQTTATGMQGAAEVYQEMFGKAGDPVAADLFQSAKVFAGVLEEAAGKAKSLSEAMGGLEGEATGLAEADFTVHAEATKAEATMGDMEEATAKAAASTEELEKLAEESNPNLTDAVNASAKYYPVMYFVDKAGLDMPSTCGGDAAERPMLGSMDECARACDNDVHECVAFSYFPAAGGLEESGICFLIKKLKSATYYTQCKAAGPATQGAGGGASRGGGGGAPAFDTSAVTCVVKFAEFEGDTLKPDPSGKCEVCMKEVTKADRCFA